MARRNAVDPYWECRPGNEGHAWFWFPSHKTPDPGYAYKVSRCQRCTSKRTGLFHLSTGQLEGSYVYEHPADWRYYERGTRPTAAQFRLMGLKERKKQLEAADRD